MPTREGDARPCWMLNIAPPIEENSAATAKMKALNKAGSYPEKRTRSSRSRIATSILPSRLLTMNIPTATHNNRSPAMTKYRLIFA